MNHPIRLVVGGCLVFLLGCASTPESRTATTRPVSRDPDRTAELTVFGMSCPQCAHNIELQLSKVRGVEAIEIDLGAGRVLVEFSETRRPSRSQLYAAVHASGFTVKDIRMPTEPAAASQPAE